MPRAAYLEYLTRKVLLARGKNSHFVFITQQAARTLANQVTATQTTGMSTESDVYKSVIHALCEL